MLVQRPHIRIANLGLHVRGGPACLATRSAHQEPIHNCPTPILYSNIHLPVVPFLVNTSCMSTRIFSIQASRLIPSLRNNYSYHTSKRLQQLSKHFQPYTTSKMPPVPKGMKAVVIEETGGPEVMQYKTNWPVPEAKEGQVLVKNSISGVNYIDTYVFS